MMSDFSCRCSIRFNTEVAFREHMRECPGNNPAAFNPNPFSPAQTLSFTPQIFANRINLNPSPVTKTFSLNFIQPRKCRYDDIPIHDANSSQYSEVCSNPECINEYLGKCKKIFSCGHECNGLADDSDKCGSSFKCLIKNCKEYNNIYNQDASSNCPICLTDPLSTFSLIHLPCKHYVHKKCFLTRLEMKWSGKEINFGFIKCSLCNVINNPEIKNDNNELKFFTNNKEIQNLYNYGFSLFKTISELAIGIKEGKTEENSDKNQEKVDFEKYTFYICDKCDKPFYGGLRECRENPEENLNEESDSSNKKLCLDCFDYTKIKGVTNCETHGRKHIQYKCKFCCNVSSHFCFGTTHFCEDCHIRQLKGDYLTTKDINELPECPGKEECVLKIDHPSNGEEFGLYCLLCLK